MRQKYWQPDRAERQTRSAFMRFCKNAGLPSSPFLWEAFKEWRASQDTREFREFHNFQREQRSSLAAAMTELANPFANGNKGMPYEIFIQLPVTNYVFHGLKEAGLSWEKHPRNPRLCVISGTPETAGEFPVDLIYQLDGALGRAFPVLRRSFRLIINPDPKELWNNIPSDQAGEYARPDEEYQHISCGGVELYGASLRGRSHAHKGQPRDDAFALACADGWQFLAVADGAGSAEFSRKGAELACQTAIDSAIGGMAGIGAQLAQLLASYAPGDEESQWQVEARKMAYACLAQAAFAAYRTVRDEASLKGRNIRLYASTLLLAGITRLPRGWLVMSFQIGDGAMALFAENGPVLLAQPDEGEYGGQTRFVTMAEIFEPHELMRRLRVSYVARLEEVLLMTDGVSDPRFASSQDLANPELWQNLQQDLGECLGREDAGPALLEWLNFWEKGHHDDRTLAILVTDGR